MIRAAIVGLGWWGKVLVTSVQGKSQHIKFTHGVLRNPGPLAEFAATHGLMLVSDYEELLTNQEVDVVVLATPHSLHADQVVAAARAGKHVFCEKPLAMNGADANRAVDACALAGRVLAVGHNKRFWASMVALRDVVASGTLGNILHIEGNSSNQNSGNFAAWRENPAESPGGGLMGSGIHILDAMVSVAGPVKQVFTQLLETRGGADPRDTLTAVLKFSNGISGTLAAVRATPMFWRVHVFGDQGSVESLSETSLLIRRPGNVIERVDVNATNSVLAEMDAFAHAVLGGAAFPITPSDMVGMVKTCNAILVSAETGQSVIV
jgi:hypothetical protein